MYMVIFTSIIGYYAISFKRPIFMTYFPLRGFQPIRTCLSYCSSGCGPSREVLLGAFRWETPLFKNVGTHIPSPPKTSCVRKGVDLLGGKEIKVADSLFQNISSKDDAQTQNNQKPSQTRYPKPNLPSLKRTHSSPSLSR